MGSVDTPLEGVYKRILIADRDLDARVSGIRKVAGRSCPVRGRSLGGVARFAGEFGFDHFRKETEEL
jgi:hypothetical protein